jgi:hypothetical protein
MKKRIWPRLGETLVAQATEAGLDGGRAFPAPPGAEQESVTPADAPAAPVPAAG